MTPGIHTIPFAEYLADPAVSNSDLKLVARSPAHYYAARLDPKRPAEEPSKSMILGSALHCAILEPAEFTGRYCAPPADAPKDMRRFADAKKPAQSTLDAIAWWESFDAENAGKTILSETDMNQVLAAANSIRGNDELYAFLHQGQFEQSVFARDPETGVMCKTRPDWLTTMVTKEGEYTIMLDLKSTEDARPYSFAKTAYSLGYFQGAAFYCDVHAWATRPQDAADDYRSIDSFLLVAFERDPPFAMRIYEVGPDELRRGRVQYRQALNVYAECLKNYEWPAYDTTIQTLEYPAWAKE